MRQGDVIRAWLDHYGWTVAELARRSGVAFRTLNEVIRPNGKARSYSASNLGRVAAALGLTSEALQRGQLPATEAAPERSAIPVDTLPLVAAAAISRWGKYLTDEDWAALAGAVQGLAARRQPQEQQEHPEEHTASDHG